MCSEVQKLNLKIKWNNVVKKTSSYCSIIKGESLVFQCAYAKNQKFFTTAVDSTTVMVICPSQLNLYLIIWKNKRRLANIQGSAEIKYCKNLLSKGTLINCCNCFNLYRYLMCIGATKEVFWGVRIVLAVNTLIIYMLN